MELRALRFRERVHDDQRGVEEGVGEVGDASRDEHEHGNRHETGPPAEVQRAGRFSPVHQQRQQSWTSCTSALV